MRALIAALALGTAIAPPADGGAAAQVALDANTAIEPRTDQRDPVFMARLEKEQRLQDLGWKLVSGNAAYCDIAVSSVGLQLLDVASFRQPDIIRRALGLEHDFAVLTVAAGSPAERAGLTSLEPITHIDGMPLADLGPRNPLNWQRAEQAHETIEALLRMKGAVTLGRPGKPPLTLKGVPACATRFELTGGDDIALADGKRVRFSGDYPAFGYADDELAAVIAHELAHNLLKHRAWLDANGRENKRVRMTEREADRLAPWLLANAGLAPEAAARFMQRWGPEHGSGFLRKRTHEGWDERLEHIQAEIPLVLQALRDDGHANWKTRFHREINPTQ